MPTDCSHSSYGMAGVLYIAEKALNFAGMKRPWRLQVGKQAKNYLGFFLRGIVFACFFFFPDCSNILEGQQTKQLYCYCPYGTCFRTQVNSLNNCHNHYELKQENFKTLSTIIISFTKCNKQHVEQKYLSSEFQIPPRAV